MNQTLALRKCISNDRNNVVAAAIDPISVASTAKIDLSNEFLTGGSLNEYAGLLPAIKSSTSTTSSFSIQPGKTINFDAINKGAVYPPACIELVDSTEWLKRYGLRANRLNLESILGSIGFKKAQGIQNNIKFQLI